MDVDEIGSIYDYGIMVKNIMWLSGENCDDKFILICLKWLEVE
jgi:hypothetical protein